MWLSISEVIGITILICTQLAIALLLTARIYRIIEGYEYKLSILRNQLRGYTYVDVDADYERAKENELWNTIHTAK